MPSYHQLTEVRFASFTTAERDAEWPDPPNDLVIYNSTTAQLEIYLNETWVGIQDGHGYLVVGNDANFYLRAAGTTPLILWDTGDYSYFDRSGNRFGWQIGDTDTILLKSGVLQLPAAMVVEFQERATPTTPAANFGRLYAKDVGGLPHPHWLDDAGTETDLFVPTATNIDGGNWKILYTDGSGDVTEVACGADNTVLKFEGAAAAPTAGQVTAAEIDASAAKQSILLTAGGGAPTTTSGCGGPTKVEAGTNDVDYWVLEFDKDSDEFAFWGPIPTPDNWDASTLTAVFYWTTASGGAAETVSWDIQMIALDDNDAIDRAWGTAVTVNDTWIADGDIHESAVSGAITPATTVSRAAGDMLFVRVMRDVSDDDLGGDARLIAVKMEFGVTALSA